MTRRGEVARSEWRWVAAWIAVALIVTSVPPLIGAARSTPDRVFGGATFAVEDVNSYLAKMRQGASGEWMFQMVYTSEPHDSALLFIFYFLLGKFAALTDLPLEFTYHLARIVFGALMLVTIYRCIATLTASIAIRHMGFLFVAFSGGLGWVLMLAGQPTWLGSPPLDLILPEGFTFLVLYAFPHIALARTFLLLGLLLVWRQGRARQESRWDAWLDSGLAGACWTAMGLAVPFYALVVYAILAGGFVADALRRSVDWRQVRRTILACAIGATVPVYVFATFATNPVLAAWGDQNRLMSPHPLHYIVAYGIVGGLALVSLRWAWRRGDRLWGRLVGWALIVPLLLYLPFDFANVVQRRLIESWQIPLSILASVTLVRVVLPAFRRWRVVHRLARLPRYTSGGLQRWALSAILLLTTPTFGLLLLDQTARVATRQWPIFHAGGEVAVVDWLSTRVRYADVVLCAYATGNYLPARASARVFVGHGVETIHLAEKLPLVAKFYAPETDDAWRQTFLREWGIDWVVAGPFERELGAADLSGKRYLQLLYDAGGYQIYRVSESVSQRVGE